MASFQSIQVESNQNVRLPIGIDFMRTRYKTENEIFSFPSPEIATIDKYMFYLLRYSTQKKFEIKYSMRPDYLSYDEYGTVLLAQLLMVVNGVFCVEEFNLENVVVPDFQAITYICQDKFDPNKDVDELVEVNW